MLSESEKQELVELDSKKRYGLRMGHLSPEFMNNLKEVSELHRKLCIKESNFESNFAVRVSDGMSDSYKKYKESLEFDKVIKDLLIFKINDAEVEYFKGIIMCELKHNSDIEDNEDE